MFDSHFWKISGVVLWGLILIYGIVRLVYGKRWPIKLGSSLFLGSGLKAASKRLVGEFKLGKVKDETITEVGVHVFWRLTRIGIIGLAIAAIPIVLLMQQNSLLGVQNDLFRIQDSLFVLQNDKLEYQNQKIDVQTSLLEQQNSLLSFQNELFVNQNSKIDTQNYSINLQNNLLEADRRSSLIILMSNILDDINNEINNQRRSLSRDSLKIVDSTGYSLSPPLIGRISSLSQGFRPYRVLEAGQLTEKALSIERAQLLLALASSNLNFRTTEAIHEITPFFQTDLRNAVLTDANLFGIILSESNLSGVNFDGTSLESAYLNRANLTEASLQDANLYGTDLLGATLHSAQMSYSNLEWANFSEANLYNADLSRANLSEAIFINSSLIGANLSQANLHQTNFNRANLTSVDFSYADFEGADLTNADLSLANLERATNLTVEQLLTTKCLVGAKGIFEWLTILQSEKPCLFTHQGCSQE